MLHLGKKKKVNTNIGRVRSFPIKRLLLGSALAAPGVIFFLMYLADPRNVVVAFGSVLFLALGGYLLYTALFQNQGQSGYRFGEKLTGRENAIVHFARRDNGKDIPVCTRIIELKHPPHNARLHFVRNWKKHFYELYNTREKKLAPVVMPDKVGFPPEQYQVAATMQVYKDAIDYNPSTLLQKLAPGLILGAMGIVGLLMVITLA